MKLEPHLAPLEASQWGPFMLSCPAAARTRSYRACWRPWCRLGASHCVQQLKEATMSSKGRMIGIHQLELKPGITAEQFEQFLAREFQHQRTPSGWKTSILKGDRGERTGRYAVM